MTTIIAKVNEKSGTIDMAWDSQATAGPRTYHTDKVVTVNGQFRIGVAGHARYGDILQYAGGVPHIHDSDLEDESFDARGWLITQAVPAWIRALKEAEKEHLEREDWANGVALIILAGRIFELGRDFSVTEDLEYGGIGSGSSYAIGAMAAGKSVEAAIKIAAEHDPGTGGRLQVERGIK